MITEFFQSFFQSAISDAPCFDQEDTSCLESINLVSSTSMNVFLGLAIVLTVVFILLATLPKNSFKSQFFSDIFWRRICFIFGFIVTLLLLNLCWGAAILLCNLRTDSDVAAAVFTATAKMYYYISMIIYPLLFWLVAFIFNKFLKRRKLFSIFISNNKIFGLK